MEKARDIAQVESPEAPDGGVGLDAVTQRALLEVEAELLDEGTVQDDQGLGARGIAAVLDAVARVGHRLDQRDQDGHVLGPTASHDPVDGHVPHGGPALVGQEDTQLGLARPVRPAQELGDTLGSGRHDGQAVAPVVLVEEAIDLVQIAFEDDVGRPRLHDGIAHARDGLRQVPDHRIHRHRRHVVP